MSYGHPIKVAVANWFNELTKPMIKAGANVNGTSGGPETTLRLAEGKGHERMAKMLRACEALIALALPLRSTVTLSILGAEYSKVRW